MRFVSLLVSKSSMIIVVLVVHWQVGADRSSIFVASPLMYFDRPPRPPFNYLVFFCLDYSRSYFLKAPAS